MYRSLFLFPMFSAIILGQSFVSGSTGADGALNITAPGVTLFDQAPVGGGTVFNFTTINIATGSTLRFSGANYGFTPYLLAQGAVMISGIIDLSGGNGQSYGVDPSLRLPSAPGSGGFSGGVGAFGANPAQPGNGPGGGQTNQVTGGNCVPHAMGGAGGTFTGNQFLVPLVGGSGGAGASASTGGAGGGAILIASSTSITVNGTITGNGGTAASPAGSGSGGGIRLAANILAGSGTLTVAGGGGVSGCSPVGPGGNGVVRLEAFQNSFTGTIVGQLYEASPFNTFIPSMIPSVQVISVGGMPVNSTPTGSFTVPDVTVNSNSPLTVQIQAQNIPLQTIVTLYIFSENGPDQTITSTALTGTLATSSATALVTLPSGYSRGYLKASWVQ